MRCTIPLAPRRYDRGATDIELFDLRRLDACHECRRVVVLCQPLSTNRIGTTMRTGTGMSRCFAGLNFHL